MHKKYSKTLRFKIYIHARHYPKLEFKVNSMCTKLVMMQKKWHAPFVRNKQLTNLLERERDRDLDLCSDLPLERERCLRLSSLPRS